MIEREKIAVGMDMLYLARCALHSQRAEAEKLTHPLSLVFRMARFHSLAALCAYALDGAFEGDEAYPAFCEARNRSISKNAMFDIERGELMCYCEEAGIRYMPLKGVWLKNFYPKSAMRQMADNDIWYDGAYQEKIVAWFTARGYSAEVVGKSNHDVFMKPPVFNFEMHTDLYDALYQKEWHGYYADKWETLSPMEGRTYGLRFSDEDFYIYIISHAYKHHTKSGTGLRTLTDLYVMTEHFGESLDRAYMEREMRTLGILDFERTAVSLCRKLFAEEEALSEEEREMLDTILCCGTFGTLESSVRNGVMRYQTKEGKVTSRMRWKYIGSRLFLPPEVMKQHYHAKYKWMLPFCYLYRFAVRGILGFGRLTKELLTVWKTKA